MYTIKNQFNINEQTLSILIKSYSDWIKLIDSIYSLTSANFKVKYFRRNLELQTISSRNMKIYVKKVSMIYFYFSRILHFDKKYKIKFNKV